MNKIIKKSIRVLALLIVYILCADMAHAGIIFQDDFESYTGSITGWQTSSNIYLDKSGGLNNSKCAKVTYNKSGTEPYWFRYKMRQDASQVYVRFNFRMDKPSGGSKFLKLFGKSNSPTGYANTTFGINYFSGKLEEVSYGAGYSINDTQDVIRYNGSHTDKNVVIQHSTDRFEPGDGKWHLFEAYMKFNDNGKRNGFYQVWIDGKLILHATNVVNRSDRNSPYLDSIDLANYCHDNWSKTWNLWYDNVVIADTYMGTGEVRDTTPPAPPAAAAPPAAPTGMKIDVVE